MSRNQSNRVLIALAMILGLVSIESVSAESVSVSAHTEVVTEGGTKNRQPSGSRDVAVWLTPVRDSLKPLAVVRSEHYRLIQKDKNFTPHLLVVPVGSSVEFPNLDPFYHNVFSLFNGKRFDLGLYEAGSTRTVHFDHEGVSYIFCNIHPQMGAVVIAVPTPYFAVSAENGNVALHDVPDGMYEVNVWAEGASPESLKNLTRIVHIGPEARDLGMIHVAKSIGPVNHKNKFGEDYTPAANPY